MPARTYRVPEAAIDIAVVIAATRKPAGARWLPVKTAIGSSSHSATASTTDAGHGEFEKFLPLCRFLPSPTERLLEPVIDIAITVNG